MSEILKPLMTDETGQAIVEALTQQEMTQTRIAEINAAAVASKQEIGALTDSSKQSIETKTDEQVARIPEVTKLSEDVGQLKNDLSANANADAITRRGLDALWKLNQGISYHFEQDNTESYQKTVPSGAKLASIEQIGGKTEVIDGQLVSADVIEVTEQGKNLFDLTAFVKLTPEIYAISDGGLIIKKLNNDPTVPIFLTLPAGDYCVSVTNTSRIQVIVNGVKIIDKYFVNSISFTLTEESQVGFRFNSPNYEQYPFPHNVGFVQLEKGAAKTDYAPYRCNRYPIPDAVRNLTGYGWSAGEVCNAIEKTGDGWQYVQRVGSRSYQEGDVVTDGIATYYALDTPVVTDITNLMNGLLDAIPVEAGGTLTFENAAKLPVPSSVEYAVKISSVPEWAMQAEKPTYSADEISYEGNITVGESISSLKGGLNKEITDRNSAISKAVNEEKNRAVDRENEIEKLFAMPTQEAVNTWLNEHPEATTTVQDNTITMKKIKVGELGYVIPEIFGAKGNGIDDDTVPIKNALDSGYPVVFLNKTYLINSEIDTSVAHTVIGNNTTFKTNKTTIQNLLTIRCKSIRISGLKFDFEQKNAYGAIRIVEPDNCIISDIEVCNISEKGRNVGVVCISIEKPFNCDISNIYIHDCTCETNNIVGDFAGNVTGVKVQRFTGKCSIHDSYFENLHSVDSGGNITFEDSNAIYPTELNSEAASCHIYSCSGKDVGKRFIKTQCTCTVIIDNCNYINTKNDFLASISIQSTEQAEQTEKGKGIISNCNLVNIAPIDPSVSSRPMLIATSEEVIVDNCRLYPGYMYAFGGEGYFCINKCIVKGYGFLLGDRSKYNVSDCVFSGISIFYNNSNNFCANFNNSLFYKDSEYNGLTYGSQCSTDAQNVYLSFFNCEFNDITLSFGSAVFSLDSCVFNSLLNNSYLVETKTNVSSISYIRNCRFRNIGNDVVREIPLFNIQNHKLCLENLVFEMGNSSGYAFDTNYCELSLRSGVSMKDSNFVDSVIESIIPCWEESEPTRKNYYCDGYKYLNVNDGKLYTFNKESKMWNPVN